MSQAGYEPQYWISDNGQTYGPVPLDTLREGAATGRLSHQAMAIQVGGANWFSVTTLGYHGGGGMYAPSQVIPAQQSPPNRRGLWIGVGVAAVLLCVVGVAGFAAVVREFGRQSVERNQAIDAIQRASIEYNQDTGQYPATARDLKSFDGPPGYDGPYLPDDVDVVDPFTGSEYQLDGCAVVDEFSQDSFEYEYTEYG
ncbi:MAG: hypothetical protein GF320_02340 [Armatimonadia bacterium]|nr:hypothetical protein [Armatimonadia bacterium]